MRTGQTWRKWDLHDDPTDVRGLYRPSVVIRADRGKDIATSTARLPMAVGRVVRWWRRVRA